MNAHLTALLVAISLASFAIPSNAWAGDAAAGAALFNANCMSCHGISGKGDGPVGAALTPPPRNFAIGDFAFDADGNEAKGEDADLTLVITNGAMKYGGSPLMAPWPTLTEAQIGDVIAHIRSLKVEE